MNDALKDGTENISREHVGKWVINVIRNTPEYVKAGGPTYGVYLWDYKDLEVTLIGNAETDEEVRQLTEDKKRALAVGLMRRGLGLDEDDNA